MDIFLLKKTFLNSWIFLKIRNVSIKNTIKKLLQKILPKRFLYFVFFHDISQSFNVLFTLNPEMTVLSEKKNSNFTQGLLFQANDQIPHVWFYLQCCGSSVLQAGGVFWV